MKYKYCTLQIFVSNKFCEFRKSIFAKLSFVTNVLQMLPIMPYIARQQVSQCQWKLFVTGFPTTFAPVTIGGFTQYTKTVEMVICTKKRVLLYQLENRLKTTPSF